MVAAGLDAMPSGSRANRMTRSVAIILAEKTGKETHIISEPEMAYHNHGGATTGGMSGAADRSLATATDGQGSHNHLPAAGPDFAQADGSSTSQGGTGRQNVVGRVGSTNFAGHHAHNVGGVDHLHSVPALGIYPNGSNIGHENVQPTVFVPYIVYLGG